MNQDYYNKETIGEMFKFVHDKLDIHTAQNTTIIEQVKKTNGRVNKLERNLFIIGAVVLTLLFTNGSELVSFILKVI